MAISQGFNLPPTGRIGRTTTGHRSGSYNLRVIPDVDANSERSDKQKAENSKFGYLSDMLNQKLEFLKIGFPKAYQPLNYAIKKNISLVSNTDDGFTFDFPKAIFSEGKVPLVSPTNLTLGRNSSTGVRYCRIDFIDDYPNGNPEDRIFVIYYIKEIKLLIYFPTTFDGSQIFRTRSSGRCYTYDLRNFRYYTAQISIFLFNNKASSKTIYCGEIYIDW